MTRSVVDDREGLGASSLRADRATDAAHGAADASPPSGSISTGAGALYEIVNPSDPVTMLARSFEAALLATLLVGTGQYAAQPVDHDGEKVPIFLFGGFEEWLAKRYPGKELSELIDEHEADVIAALRSFCTGKPSDRRLYDAALKAITDPDKRAEFVAGWDDQKRSSLNQITNRANAIADRLEASSKAREQERGLES